ncbi:replication/maintenance protein RepL [Fibrella forsythiae]|uniref:Replication/maintenance protein RepL n=1 Tax=Fibrella forsythiae TaxID=2817061 RepID=A0ABS3JTB4_9BACT|nr:replication/maintenance protein RepL [Fibrella forsythiae]MBO0953253.1 replication/maintenance protein RepL [Fibrella forsythiae]
MAEQRADKSDLTPKHTTNLKAFPFHSSNPFLDNLMLDTKRKLVATANPKDKIVIDQMTGQMDDTMFIGIRKEVDGEQFVKIFINELSGMFELSKVGSAVFSYVLKTMDFSDRITFDLTECQKLTGYKSRVSVLAGLTELLEKHFLARGHLANVYFINPAVAYKGDRLLLLTEYRRKGVKRLKEQEQQQATLGDGLSDS